MAIYHLQSNQIGRSSGRSATGAAAYRSASLIVDERTGITHDYTRKRGVLFSSLMLPHSEESPDRETFWNAVENKHRRKDAILSREFEVALPHELSDAEHVRLVSDYARELANRYGVAADVSIHAPRTVSDSDIKNNPEIFYVHDIKTKKRHNLNYHAHIMLSSCRVTHDGTLGNKCVELDPIHCQRAKIKNAVEVQRERWAKITNQAIKNKFTGDLNMQTKIKIDHRSNHERGIISPPSFHIGPTASAINRRGGLVLKKSYSERERERNEIERIKILTEKNLMQDRFLFLYQQKSNEILLIKNVHEQLKSMVQKNELFHVAHHSEEKLTPSQILQSLQKYKQLNEHDKHREFFSVRPVESRNTIILNQCDKYVIEQLEILGLTPTYVQKIGDNHQVIIRLRDDLSVEKLLTLETEIQEQIAIHNGYEPDPGQRLNNEIALAGFAMLDGKSPIIIRNDDRIFANYRPVIVGDTPEPQPVAPLTPAQPPYTPPKPRGPSMGI